MTNYISFSLYGKKAIYSCGAIENARLSMQLYPGWKTVFYVGKSVETSTLRALAELDAKVIRRPEEESPNAMFWRFDAVALPGAKRVIVRDADSRLSQREAVSVNEWIESGKGLHVIRDHPWHSQNILGGMWGVQGSRALELVSQNLPKNVDGRGLYGDDQDFLSQVIYPKFIDNVLAHDSFYRFTPGSVPLGPRKNNEFIGEVIQCNGEFDKSLRVAISRYESSLPLKWLLRLTRFFQRFTNL